MTDRRPREGREGVGRHIESDITGGAIHLGMDTSKNTGVVATLTPDEGVPVGGRMWNEEGWLRGLTGRFSVLLPLIVRTASPIPLASMWLRRVAFG